MKTHQSLYKLFLLFFITTTTIYAHKTDKLGIYDRPDIYWIQTSNEYQNVTKSLYYLAQIQLDEILKNKEKSAFLEQKDNFKNLPPAVIMDIDDTILNTTNFAVYMNLNPNKGYSTKDWNKYVKQEISFAILGSVEFINYALSKGVTVFFVSNRTHDGFNATLNNLKKVGINVPNMKDRIMLVRGKKNWDSNKYNRYKEIAKKYYISMIIGDNMTDFLAPFAEDITYKEYKKLNKIYASYIGKYWIQIPATTYGSWQNIKDINKEIETVIIK